MEIFHYHLYVGIFADSRPPISGTEQLNLLVSVFREQEKVSLKGIWISRCPAKSHVFANSSTGCGESISTTHRH